MDIIKIGVLGAYRGTSMINYCRFADNAKVVAICDKSDIALKEQQERIGDDSITYYKDFDEFIKHDMDAVVLANYANEHAPFAIKCMKNGKHVFSEVLPIQTMKEAVELVECIEETGMTYAYGENYCFMAAPREMTKLYREGVIGEFDYGECEYIHNCGPIWPSIAYGDPDHWRNNMYSTFYCTHSIGPLIHMTKLRPVSVTGFESTRNERPLSVGRKGANMGIEMITLENGAIIKSIHGGLYKNSIWYCAYGTKGRMESAREDAWADAYNRIHINADGYTAENEQPKTYLPDDENTDSAKAFGHGGSDFYSMYYFVEKLLGHDNDEVIDIYEALDMFLPGMFAYRSILNGGIPMEIPNLRDKAVRDKYRNDTMCTDPKVAGDMLLPTSKGGTPDIDPKVYEIQRELYLKELDEGSPYREAVYAQNKKGDV